MATVTKLENTSKSEKKTQNRKEIIQSKEIDAFRDHLYTRGYKKLVRDTYRLEIKAIDLQGNLVKFNKEEERCAAYGRVFYYIEERPCMLKTHKDNWSQLCRQWADENKFNPAKDWFKNLKKPKKMPKESMILRWFKPDYDMWDRAIEGITKEEVDRHTVNGFKSMLKSIYRRTMFPGCKQDYLYILIGEQGIAKSLFTELLCPDSEWYLEGISGKDLCGSQTELGRLLKGVMVAEPKELNLGQRNKEAYKSILSQKMLKFDEKWEPKEDVPRTDTMIATSNHEELLAVDTTGNRRMVILPVAMRKEMTEKELRELWSELKEDLPAYYWEVIQEFNETKETLLPKDQRQAQEHVAKLLTHTDDSIDYEWAFDRTMEFFGNRKRNEKLVCVKDFFDRYQEAIKEQLGRLSQHVVGKVWRELGLKKVSRKVVNRRQRHMWRIPDDLLVDIKKDLSVVVDNAKLRQDEGGNYHAAE